jgi:hypothetical protein
MYSDCICYMNKKLENKRKSKENKKYGKNRVIFYKCLHFKNYDLPDAFFNIFWHVQKLRFASRIYYIVYLLEIRKVTFVFLPVLKKCYSTCICHGSSPTYPKKNAKSHVSASEKYYITYDIGPLQWHRTSAIIYVLQDAKHVTWSTAHTCSEMSYRIIDVECIWRAKTLQFNLTQRMKSNKYIYIDV